MLRVSILIAIIIALRYANRSMLVSLTLYLVSIISSRNLHIISNCYEPELLQLALPTAIANIYYLWFNYVFFSHRRALCLGVKEILKSLVDRWYSIFKSETMK